MATAVNEHYLRAVLLLSEGGSYIAKEILNKELAREGIDLDTLLLRFKSMLKHELHPKQIEKLFPLDGRTDVNSWDLQMLTVVILRLFRSSLSNDIKDKLNIIKLQRHEVLALSPSASLSEFQYEDIQDQLTRAIRVLASVCDKTVQTKCEDLIAKFSSGLLDIEFSRRQLQETQNTDVLFKEALKYLQELKDEVIQCINTSTATTIMPSTLSEKMAGMEKNIIEMLERLRESSEKMFSKTVKVQSNIELTVSGPSQEVIDTVEQLLTCMFVKPDSSEEDFEELKRSVNQLIADLESKGITLKQSVKKCIILHFECCTYAAVLEFLCYMRSGEYQDWLEMLAHSLKKKYQLEEELNIYSKIPLSCLEFLKSKVEWELAVSDKQQHDELDLLENKKTPAEVYERSLKLVLECTSPEGLIQIMDFFYKGIVLNYLHRIAKALKSHYSIPVTLSSSLNLTDFKNILETTFADCTDDEISKAETVSSTERLAQEGNLATRGRHDYLQGVDEEEPKISLVHYAASVKSWPRVFRSQQLINDLTERCTYLENLFFYRTNSENTNELGLKIDIYLNNKTLEECPAGLLVRGNDITKQETLHLQIIKDNDRTVAPFNSFAGVLIDTNGVELIRKVTKSRMYIDDVKFRFEKLSNRHGLDIENAKSEISSLLEGVVFEKLHTKCIILKNLRESKVPDGYEARDGFEAKLQENKDIIDQLLGEIIALFNRSTLPEKERPQVKGFEKKKVCEKVKTCLFKFDETIRGFGYRYSTFVVNIEHSAEEEERMEKIKMFLKSHGIDDIQFSFVSKSVTEYLHVGAEMCENENGELLGTLGAFAQFTKDGETDPCAIISKHVAKRLTNLKLYIKENESTREVGGVIVETLTERAYDIAAAKLYPEYKGRYDPSFKNSDNEPREGLLYDGRCNLQSLHVHMFGAKTSPGKGIIDIPKLRYGPHETYIQVRDRPTAGDAPVQRMAEPGDSGSIICADTLDDDKVHVIAMLMGSNNHKEESRRSYIALPLLQGVKQLEYLTAGTFLLERVTRDPI